MTTYFRPYPYQRYAINRVISDKALGLFLDMGLGKTIITLMGIVDLKYNRFAVSKVLVIAPKRVAAGTWDEEAAKWTQTAGLRFSKILGSARQRIAALNTPADIYTINVDNVAWLVDYERNNWRFDMVVIDEASKFKSYSARRFKALKCVRPHISRIVELTGTPASNGMIDLWAPVYLLDGGQRLGKTITAFRESFCKIDTHGGNYTTYTLSQDMADGIRERISDICVSMKSEDYLDLPERVVIDVKVKLPEDAKKKYDALERNLVTQIDVNQLSASNAAVLSGKLLQFAGGAVYDENHNVVQVHDAKLDALEDLIDGLNGQHAIVFYHFAHELDRIKARLAEMGVNYRELQTDADRVAWNTGEIDILLAHPASAGHGLNLQYGGYHEIFYSTGWSLENYEQALKRLHRQGQTERVIVHRLVAEGTRDEVVMQALSDKRDVQEALLESLKAKKREIELLQQRGA